MSFDYLLADFEPEFRTVIDGATVEVGKVGGGTVGESYAGAWLYRFTAPDGTVELGADLTTGMPKSHAEAAEIVALFFDMEEEN